MKIRQKEAAVHLWVARRGTSTAAAAAAEEQENDEDDPDPVVVVEYVAQAVVHKEPPYGKNLEGGSRLHYQNMSKPAEGAKKLPATQKKTEGVEGF